MITTLFVSIILTTTELVRVKQQLDDYNIVLTILTITELVRVKQQLNDYNIVCFDHFNNYRVSKS